MQQDARSAKCDEMDEQYRTIDRDNGCLKPHGNSSHDNGEIPILFSICRSLDS